MAYTVKAGDSYWAIAQALLGDGTRWPEIKAMNGGKNMIHPGQQLDVPGDAPTNDGRVSVIGPGKPAIGGQIPDQNPVTGAPVASPNSSLMQDPAYAAFLAGIGVQESDIQGNLDVARSNYLQQFNQALPGYEDARTQSSKNIGLNAENRGLYQSGSRLRDQGEAVGRIDAQQEAARSLMTRNIAGAERAASQDTASLRRKQALEEIAARERLTARDIGALA